MQIFFLGGGVGVSLVGRWAPVKRNSPVGRNIRETRRGGDFPPNHKRRVAEVLPCRMLLQFCAKQPAEIQNKKNSN